MSETVKEYLWRIILVDGESSNTLLIEIEQKFASDFRREQTIQTFFDNIELVLEIRSQQLPHTYPQILQF